jgi:chondroitin AC lyase
MRTLYFFSLVFLINVTFSHITYAQNDLKTIKDRVRTELMNQPVTKRSLEILITEIKENGTWPEINYEDISRTGFEHRNHTANMVLLAKAYQNKSSEYYKNKKVKRTLELALKNWVDNDYICDNWWHNQIGVPNQLVTLMLIMGDELPDDLVKKSHPIIGRAHINASGARPGGDRIKIAGIQAKNMLFLNNGKTFDEVIRVIETDIICCMGWCKI